MSDNAVFGVNTSHTDSTQPKPQAGQESITDAVIGDLLARREHGVRKYGTELQSHNGRDAMVEIYQELIDSVVYVKQLLMERDAAPQLRPIGLVCRECGGKYPLINGYRYGSLCTKKKRGTSDMSTCAGHLVYVAERA